MRTMNWVALVIVSIATSACQTITFRRSTGSSWVKHEQWHSSTLYGLVEASDPVEPADICGDDMEWHEVKTKETLGSALISGWIGILWDPTGVEVTCSQPASRKP